MNEQDLPETVQISSRLVKNKKIVNHDMLSSKYEFNQVGSNGFLEIEPSTLKF